MAARGENIGEAYIRIFSDGSGLDESIRRQFSKQEPVIRKSAREQGDLMGEEMADAFDDTYKGSFRKNWDKTQREMLTDLERGFGKQFAKMKLADNFFNSKGWKDLHNRLVAIGGPEGEMFATEFANRFRDSAALGGMEGAIENMGRDMRRARETVMKETERLEREENKRLEELNRDHVRALLEDTRRGEEEEVRIRRLAAMQIQALNENERRALAEELRVRRIAAQQVQAQREDALRAEREELRIRRLAALQIQAQREDEQRALDVQRRIRQESAAQLRGMRDEYQRLTIAVHHYAQGERDALRDAQGNEINRAQMVKRFEDLRQRMREAGAMTVQFSDGMDRSERSLRNLNPRLDRVNRGIFVFSDTLGRGFGRGSRNDFLNFIGSMVRNMARIPALFVNAGKGVVNWVSSINAAQGGGAKLAAALAPAVAALAGFAAIALATTFIVAPLAAALSMLAGVVVALGSSIVMGLIGAVAALAGSLVPLVAGIAVTIAAFQRMPKDAKAGFGAIKREVRGLADAAAGGFFKDWNQDVSRIQGLVGGWRGAMRSIGEAISDVRGEWISMLRAGGSSGPYAQFRAAMERFLPNAVRSLGRTFGNVGAGFANTFRAMIPLVERFLGWLQDVTGEFAGWSRTVGGQNTLKKFFSDAGDSAAALGEWLGSLTRLLGTIIGVGRNAGDTIFGDMSRAFDRWNAELKANPRILQDWFNDAVAFGRAIGTLISAVGTLFSAFDNANARVGINVFFTVLAASISSVVNSLGFFSRMMGASILAAGALAKAMPGSFLDGAGDSLIRIGTNMMQVGRAGDVAAGGANTAKNAFADMKGTLDASSGAATQLTRNLIRNRLITSGAADSFGAYGIRMRDAVGAVLGLESAQKRVTRALAAARPELEGMGAPALRAKIAELSRTFGLSQAAVRRAHRETVIWKGAIEDLPRRKQMIVSASGMPKTIAQFRDLVRDAKLVPKNIKPLVKAAGIKVTDKEMKGLIRLSQNLGKQKPTPKADLNKKGFDKNKKAADAALKDLARQKPTPAANLNKRALDNLVRKATSDLNSLDRKHPTPRVSVNPGNSFGTINALQAGLNAIRSKTVSVTTVRRVVGGRGAVARGGMFAMASGGLAEGAGGLINSRMLTSKFELGEAGPEAVVPLNRPLGQVDPAVRWLSAIAQGKTPLARGGVVGGGKTVNVGGVTLVSDTRDPKAAATEFVNTLVGKGYA